MTTTSRRPGRLAVCACEPTAGLVAGLALMTSAHVPTIDIVVPALDVQVTSEWLHRLVPRTFTDKWLVEPAVDYLRYGHDAVVFAGEPRRGGGDLLTIIRLLECGRDWLDVLDTLRTHEQANPPLVLAELARALVIRDPLKALGVASRQGVIPVGRGRLLVETSWGRPLLCLANDLFRTPDLALHGEYESNLLRLFERVLPSGGVAVDVGANVGMVTLRMADLVGPYGSVIALEANPEAYGVLLDNMSMNNVHPRIVAYNAAIGDSSAHVQFDSSGRFRGNAFISRESGASTAGSRPALPSESIPSVGIDSLLETQAWVDLIKIDVGEEVFNALRSMTRLVTDRRVGRVVFEVMRPLLGNNWAPFLELLNSLVAKGAKLSVITPRGLEEPLTIDRLVSADASPPLQLSWDRL
jgi:FkbM family methyltransferase